MFTDPQVNIEALTGFISSVRKIEPVNRISRINLFTTSVYKTNIEI